MLLLLTGAKKNAGDFLIRDRGLAIFEHVHPGLEVTVAPRWDVTDPSMVGDARAVVICGGPALRPAFVPEVHRLLAHHRVLSQPVFALAVGWSARLGETVESFSFTEESKAAIRHIAEVAGWVSVRDDLTAEVVAAVDPSIDVRRTGCVAWYSIPHLGVAPSSPEAVHDLVFTPPAQVSSFGSAARILIDLRRQFPRARRRCVFHRGIGADEHTPAITARRNRALAAVARASGFEVVDASYGTEVISSYATSDLHVGFRVHAHLAFLSYRRPSILVAEDVRGVGQLRSLRDPYRLDARQPGLVRSVRSAVRAELDDDLPGLRQAVEVVDATWPAMRDTVREIGERA